MAREFAKQTWAEGIDSKGRPIVRPNIAPSYEGTLVYPGIGATNWWSPSYSPLTHLFYVPVWERPGDHSDPRHRRPVLDLRRVRLIVPRR